MKDFVARGGMVAAQRALVVAGAAGVLALALGGCPAGTTGGACEGLLAGDLVISEVMANPAGADGSEEWLEIYNATSAPIALDGISISRAAGNGTGRRTVALPDGLSIPGDDYFVLGGILDEAAPAHIDLGIGDALGDFGNTNGQVSILCGDQVIDAMTYERTGEGAALGFDGARRPDAVANDDVAAWCDATTALDDENAGTPGATNDPCAPVDMTECMDGGALRDIVRPAAGDLIITEVMANPELVADDLGEWFEVLVTRDVDLNGLQLGKEAVEETVASADCLRVVAGDRLVFARSADATMNGGLPAPDMLFDFTLGNTDGRLFLASEAQTIDAITYATARSGRSYQVDPGAEDATDNDDAGNWCDATVSFDDEAGADEGSPGAANEVCPVVLPEGSCLEEGAMRAIVDPSAGEVTITEVMPNPAAVADGDGEWFEVRFAQAVDLNRVTINGRVIGGDACLRVPAGLAVLAANGTMATNGGLPVETVAVSFSSLTNGAGMVELAIGETVLDTFAWTSSEPGRSIAIDGEGAQCDTPADQTFGDGDAGTPRGENPTCPLVAGPGQCVDGDTVRPIRVAGVGEVFITEVMANPMAVSDADGEYVEVFSTVDTDANAWTINGGRVGDDNCVPVAADSFVVLAKNGTAAENGNIEGTVVQASFSLTNGGATLTLATADGTLDTLTYPSAGNGISTSLDPDAFDATSNDDATNLCPTDAGETYGDGDRGTPGRANPQCPIVLGPNECLDAGVPRTIDPPMAGEVRITEVHPNPAAVDDGNGEFVELYVSGDFDLAGLEIDGTAVLGDECQPVTNDSVVVLVLDVNSATNGGIDGGVLADFGLVNGGDTVAVGAGGVPLDAITYASSTSGVSIRRDAADLLCDSNGTYGAGDGGTPGTVDDTTCL